LRPSPPPAERLLGRPEFTGDLHDAAAALAGQRVLITGAAGSVGWPLAHALAGARNTDLVLLDHHEHSLFSLERSLSPTTSSIAYELADVRDQPRLRRVFERYRPQLVLHLAAAKHVPYGERFPEGVVASNVLATATLLDLAAQIDVGTLVYPSSDKSVDPPSLYGATKRIAEALVQARANARCWSVVRFVNIVGTRGSVIETFTQQVLADQPLTVTDERMTRYWISMDEALWCLLSAGAHAAPGEIVMPAVGEPIPLLETARRLAAWYRPERTPYPSICTGIRPGERLHEALLSGNERFEHGPAAGLLTVRSSREPPRLDSTHNLVRELRELVEAGDREALARTARRAAADLQ
jgi:FlaA1/EpsC-like NDP-sugar epimerase